MTTNNGVKRYQYNLKTLTHVHIGTGETMIPLEYHLSKDRLNVPDLDQLFADKPAMADTFTQSLAKKSIHELPKTKMAELLNKTFLEMAHVQRYRTKVSDDKDQFHYGFANQAIQIDKGAGEIRVATKAPNHKIYIPGSSIKGALRTAWTFNECLNNQDWLKRLVLNQMQDADPRRLAGAIDNEIKRQLFQGQASSRNDACYDLFRVLQVGDSEGLSADQALCLIMVKILSTNLPAKEAIKTPQNSSMATKSSQDSVNVKFKEEVILYEAICRQAGFSGELRIDEKLLKQAQLGWQDAQKQFSLEKLCMAANKFAAKICDWEIAYYQIAKQDDVTKPQVKEVLKFYQDLKKLIDTLQNQPEGYTKLYLCLGQGSGWHKMTVGMLLEELLDKPDFTKMREQMRLADRHTNFEYPKSRKLHMTNAQEAKRPLGWVAIDFTETREKAHAFRRADESRLKSN